MRKIVLPGSLPGILSGMRVSVAIGIILLVGLIAFPAVLITWFALVIVAAVRAANGENYRYPFTMKLVS